MYKHDRLNNGINVVTRHMAEVPSFAIGVYFRACSNYEEGFPLGISHLIEHMMFKGTEKYNAKELAQQIDDIGGSINAYTSKDCTAYYAKVLYQDAEIPISLLADMLKHSLMANEDIIKEIDVVKEEIAEYEDSPDDVCYELFQKHVYAGHPLAEPVLGYAETIDGIRHQDIVAYMEKFYTAENMVISCAGNLPENLMELLEREFGDFRQGGKPLSLAQAEFLGGYCFANKDIEQTHLCLGFESINYHDQRFFALLLLSNLLGGTASSILYQKLREEHSLCYSVYSHQTFFIHGGHLTIYTSFKPENLTKVLELIAESIKELKEKFKQEQLDKAKRQLRGAYLLGLENSSSQMAMMAKRFLYTDELLGLEEIIKKIDEIDILTVQELIAEIFTEKFALAIVGEVDEQMAKKVYRDFEKYLKRGEQ